MKIIIDSKVDEEKMNFLTKIIKPKDGEPDLKQAHTGDALAARYDENLKRWIFPGEDASAVSQELAPPPMMPGPSGSAGGPKRFSATGRSLYTDPFAEMQGRKTLGSEGTVPPVFPQASLFPVLASSADAPFPIEPPAFPVDSEDVNTANTEVDEVIEVDYQKTEYVQESNHQQETHAVNEISHVQHVHYEQHYHEEVQYQHPHHQQQQSDHHEVPVVEPPYSYAGEEAVVPESEQPIYEPQTYAEQATEIYAGGDDVNATTLTEPQDSASTSFHMNGTDEATMGSEDRESVQNAQPLDMDSTVPQLRQDDSEHAHVSQVTRPVLPQYIPVSPLSDSVSEKASPRSLVERPTIPQDSAQDVQLTSDLSQIDHLANRAQSLSMIAPASPEGSSDGSPDEAGMSCEISILGRPDERGPMVFPSQGGVHMNHRSLSETLHDLKEAPALAASSSTAVVAIERAITQCVDLSVVTSDPMNRTLFCEAMEAVSFTDGPLREAARNAVELLVECLDESSVVGESEEDKLTASSALGALWNLTFSKDEAGESVASTVELVQSIKKAMTMFPTDALVQSNGSGLLVNLATDRQTQRHVVNLGVLDALVSAVKIHRDNVTLIEHTCQILSMIASRKDLKSQLPAGYCRTIVEIASKSSDPSAVRWGNWLKNLTTHV